MSEVIKILPMTTLLSELLKLSAKGWHIVGFKNNMIVLKFNKDIKTSMSLYHQGGKE